MRSSKQDWETNEDAPLFYAPKVYRLRGTETPQCRAVKKEIRKNRKTEVNVMFTSQRMFPHYS